jgi:hypothetical protein
MPRLDTGPDIEPLYESRISSPLKTFGVERLLLWRQAQQEHNAFEREPPHEMHNACRACETPFAPVYASRSVSGDYSGAAIRLRPPRSVRNRIVCDA